MGATTRLSPAMFIAIMVGVAGCASNQATETPAALSFHGVPMESPTPLPLLTSNCSDLPPSQPGNASGPVFPVQSFDAGNSQPYEACLLDWSGHIQLQMDREMPELASPNGREYATEYPTSATITDLVVYTLLDANGSVIGHTVGVARRGIMWADGSDSLCIISSNARDLSKDSSAILYLQGLNGVARAVTAVGAIRGPRPLPTPAPLPPGATGGLVPTSTEPVVPVLLGCSTQANRALVGDALTGSLRLFRLTDGKLIWQGHYTTNSADKLFGPYFTTRFVVTPDCRYLAEMLPLKGQQSTAVGPSTIRDLSANRVVAILHDPVVGFNWDGSRVVLRPSAAPHVAYLADWRSGKVISQLEFGASVVSAEPGGPGLAVGVPSTRHAFGYDVYMLDAQDNAFEVARSVVSSAPGFSTP